MKTSIWQLMLTNRNRKSFLYNRHLKTSKLFSIKHINCLKIRAKAAQLEAGNIANGFALVDHLFFKQKSKKILELFTDKVNIKTILYEIQFNILFLHSFEILKDLGPFIYKCTEAAQLILRKLGHLESEQKYQEAVDLFEKYVSSRDYFTQGLFTGAFRITTKCLLNLVNKLKTSS
jgi:hypothetical protein